MITVSNIASVDVKFLYLLSVVDSGNTYHLGVNFKCLKYCEIIVEILFKKFNAPSMFIALALILQSFSMGRQIVNIGNSGC